MISNKKESHQRLWTELNSKKKHLNNLIEPIPKDRLGLEIMADLYRGDQTEVILLMMMQK